LDVGLDYSVTHPSAPSYIAAAQAKLGAAVSREKKKEHKYGEACKAVDVSFKPFVFETYGAMGSKARSLFKGAIRIMENKLNDDDPRTWTATTFSTMWMQRMSVSLQRGNAQAILYRAARDRKGITGEPDAEPPPTIHVGR
jgi:hypothetical protein